MSMMNAELYDALIEAGASDEKARKAATSFAGDILRIKADIEKTNHELGGETLVLKWIIGIAFLAVALPSIKDFFL